MRKLIVITAVFVLMLGVQLSFTPHGEAGGPINLPDGLTVHSTLVCQYKNSKKSYEVLNLQLPTVFEEECVIPNECDEKESCSECLTELLDLGFETESSNIIPNNKVVYVLNSDHLYLICPPLFD